MLGSTCRNPKELKDKILTRLGAPVVNVEVSESQIYECIQQALELYGEYHHDGVNRVFLTIKLNEVQARTGFVDLSNYPLYAITQILRAGGTNWTIDGTATYAWFSDFVNGLAGFGGGSPVYHGPFAGSGGLSMYTMLMSHMKLLNDILNPLPDYWFNATNGQLQFFGDFKPGDTLIVEAYIASYMDMELSSHYVGNPHTNVGAMSTNASKNYDNPYNSLCEFRVGDTSSLNQNVYNVRWVKDFATALTKQMQGTNLAKNQGMQLPGGIEVDGVRLISEAKTEIEALRQELLLITEPDGIIIG